jgi:4-aminobutyrate aminotransferase-like enzyme
LAGTSAEGLRFRENIFWRCSGLLKVRESGSKRLHARHQTQRKTGPSIQQLMQKGVIVLLAGTTVIRLLLLLVISKEEIDIALCTLKKLLA